MFHIFELHDMKRYLNMKSVYGTETVDELELKDFNSYKEFWRELRRLRDAYRLCGMPVYISQRSTKDWREK